MAALHGSGGGMTFTGLTVGVESWSLNYTADQTEVSSFANTATPLHKVYLTGLKDWTATVTGHLDGTESPLAIGATGTLTLAIRTAVTADTWSGSAILQNIKVDAGVNDKIPVTYEFQGTGSLTLAFTA